MKSLRLISTTAAACGILALQGNAAIIAFGGDYVTATTAVQATTQDLLGNPTASDSIRQIGGFDVPLQPASGYTGPAFSGGAQAVKIGVHAENGLANGSVINDAGGDYINLFSQTPAGVTAGSSLNYIVSFAANSATYGSLTGFSGRTAGGVSGSLVSRFMIETTAGQYYLSNTTISGGFGGATWSISDLATESWALLSTNETGDWRGNFGSLNFNQTIASSTELANVGWFASRAVDTGTNTTLTIREFTVVPEPSTYAALLGGLILLGVLVRRRKA